MRFLRKYRFVASNTDTVIAGLRKFGLKKKHHIISLDFVSMYTNIDREQVRRIIDDEYDETIAKRTIVPKNVFLATLNTLATHNAL